MAEEPDGINEAFEGALRVGLTVAGQAGEVVARARERVLREAEAASQQQARELANRLEAERSAARAALAPVEREQWWTTADPQQVASAWETARAWRQVDPDAARAGDRIREEVRTRYGVDVDDAQPDAAALRGALAAREAAEQSAAVQRAGARRDDIEAELLMAGADRADRLQDPPAAAAQEGAGADRYDTAQRRQELAGSLAGVADAETVAARVLADTGQARPAVEAVAEPAGQQAPRARYARAAAGRAAEQQKTLTR